MRTNQRLAQLWLDALSTELGASAGTIETYTDDLTCYLAWLNETSLRLNEVGLEHIRDYIAVLDQRGYAGSTIVRRITVVRGLHKCHSAPNWNPTTDKTRPTEQIAFFAQSRRVTSGADCDPFTLANWSECSDGCAGSGRGQEFRAGLHAATERDRVLGLNEAWVLQFSRDLPSTVLRQVPTRPTTKDRWTVPGHAAPSTQGAALLPTRTNTWSLSSPAQV
jgi:hypothetical protein